MTRFSKTFPSFFDWLAKHPNASTNPTTYEKRIIKSHVKGRNLAESRGHAKLMFRVTIGSNIGINQHNAKTKYYSISLYAFSDKMFSRVDLINLEKIMNEETLSYFYPTRRYTQVDYWGTELDTQDITKRQEFNEELPFDFEVIGKWFFHIEGEEKKSGNL
jgi:hypothetical protein